jgi:hypothetical protein
MFQLRRKEFDSLRSQIAMSSCSSMSKRPDPRWVRSRSFTIREKGCSEVYVRARDEAFQLVIVVPTLQAHTDIAVIGDPVSPQYRPTTATHWPGRPDRCDATERSGDRESTGLRCE